MQFSITMVLKCSLQPQWVLLAAIAAPLARNLLQCQGSQQNCNCVAAKFKTIFGEVELNFSIVLSRSVCLKFIQTEPNNNNKTLQ